MILELVPIQSDRKIDYSMQDGLLTTTVDGISDAFEIGEADGRYTDFMSDVLPIMPIRQVIVDSGQVTARVLSPYSSRPPTPALAEKVDEETGEVVTIVADPEGHQAAVDAWNESRTLRTVEL